MRPEMLECIENFVKNGLTIVGPAPVRSPSLANYPEADRTVNEIAKLMWIPGQKVSRYKNGNVWNDKAEMSEIFTDLNLKPDLSVENGEQMPLYIHRSLDDAEVYFIANPTEDKISLNPTFRVNNGYTPQLWDATDGSIRNLSQFKTHESGGITVPMELEPLESAFIVFRNDAVAPTTYSTNYPNPDIISDLTDKPWTIEFDAKRQGPSQPLAIDSLIDWSTHPDRSIANYSGKAVYTTEFNLPKLPEGQTFLDLGKVMVMAKVKINGKYAGGAWTSPIALMSQNY